jgi:hypothetical protein
MDTRRVNAELKRHLSELQNDSSEDVKEFKRTKSIKYYGFSGFVQDEELIYVDKTPFIQHLLENKEKAIHLVIPSGFGVSTNLQMLRQYACHTQQTALNKAFFKKTTIHEAGQAFQKKHQGQYTILFLSLPFSYHFSYSNKSRRQLLLGTLSDEILDYRGAFSDREKLFNTEELKKLEERTEDPILIKQSLAILIERLKSYYDKPVILLIDQFDHPLLSEKLTSDEYEDCATLLNDWLEPAIQSPHLHKAFIVSISGLFNGDKLSLKSYSLLDHCFRDDFGFNEAELKSVISQYFAIQHRERVYQHIRFCDGYFQFGSKQLFRIWHTLEQIASNRDYPAKCLRNAAKYAPRHIFIDQILEQVDVSVQKDFWRLVHHNAILISTSQPTPYRQGYKTPSEFWNLLYLRGCITLKPLENGFYRICIQSAGFHHLLKRTSGKNIELYNGIRRCLSMLNRAIALENHHPLINNFWHIALLFAIIYFRGLNAGLELSLLTLAINETMKPRLDTTSFLSTTQKTEIFELAAKLEIPDWEFDGFISRDEHNINYDEVTHELELKETLLKQQKLLSLQSTFRKKLTELESLPVIKGYCEAKAHSRVDNYFIFKEAVDKQKGAVVIVPTISVLRK